MLKFVRLTFLFLLAVAFSFTDSNATHLRAGDITVTRYSPFSYRYKITLHIYTRYESPVKFGGGILSFGDGQTVTTDARPSPPEISPVDGGIGDVEYSVDHTYRGNGAFMITYYEQNRNEGILNISNSVNVPFFIQTQLVIDDFLGVDNSPQLLVPPIDMGCTGVAWLHNPGAYDPDGDSLSYDLYVPKLGAIFDANGIFQSSIDVAYTNPSSASFSFTNEKGNGPPQFVIDHVTGTLRWDAPGVEGEYNIAFIIRSWRKVDGEWVQLGFVERDMQIIIQSCENKRPILHVPADTCVEAGKKIITNVDDVFSIDPAFQSPRTKGDGDSTIIEAFSQVFNINPSPATYLSPPPHFPAKFQPITSNTQRAVLQFTWQTECAHIKEQPYEVVFKATDNGSPHLAAFETWRIRIVAPAPVLTGATLNIAKKSARLSWLKYSCKNAAYIEVWRKVDSTTYKPLACVTGMPDNLGFELIGQASKDSTGYTDKHLDPGARYCYRLVAVFPQPDGGESPVSNEECVPPFKAFAPVITNVTIDSTSDKSGRITVKWRPPFEADVALFPPPYSYKVYRADGYTGNINLIQVSAGNTIPDTLIHDDGVNTAQEIHNYRVFSYDKNGALMDTSAVASSVRLDLKPLYEQIELSWNADVPWSNNTVSYPMHLIYRGTKSDAKAITELTLIDSVNVNQKRFIYLDTGRYQSTPLVHSQEYCYGVMTRGSYGNPKIKAPLKNFSEITCTIPDNQTKPCAPVLVAKGYDCSSYDICFEIGKNVASNQVNWRRPADTNCRNEIKGYNVYAANSIGDTFTKIAELVTDTFYIHSNLPSHAQCYKVSAVSRAGIEGELSDQFCFENCPYYELPNVFTPNGDGCNDLFSAFNINNYLDVEHGLPCGHTFTLPGTNILDKVRNHKLDSAHLANITTRCARFVMAVNFTVFNRWGKEVYNYQYNLDLQSEDSGSSIQNPLYIYWNGKDNNGHDLDPGVYFYGCNVTFAAADPKKRNKNFKGWVQIIR